MEAAKFFGSMIGLCALLYLLALALLSNTCHTQARIMGMRSDWGFMQGCMIEYKPGKWIPIGNFRVEEK